MIHLRTIYDPEASRGEPSVADSGRTCPPTIDGLGGARKPTRRVSALLPPWRSWRTLPVAGRTGKPLHGGSDDRAELPGDPGGSLFFAGLPQAYGPILMRRRLLHGRVACCADRPGGRRELHLWRGATSAASHRATTAQTNHGDGGRCLSADSPASRLAQLAGQRGQTPGNHEGTHAEQMVQRCWNREEHQPLRGATRGRFTALSTAATKGGAASGTAVTAMPLGVGTACQQMLQRPGEQTRSEGEKDRRSFLTTPRTGIGTAVPRGTRRANNQSGQIAGEQHRFVHSLREICDDLRTGTYQRVPLINVRSRPPLTLRPWNRRWKRKRA